MIPSVGFVLAADLHANSTTIYLVQFLVENVTVIGLTEILLAFLSQTGTFIENY